MKRETRLGTAGSHWARRPYILAIFLVIQSLAVVFFIGDVTVEIIENPTSTQGIAEAITALALILGVGFGAVTLRRALDRISVQNAALATASGALGAVIDAQFHQWGLTPAEYDVGFLALKGLDVAEIATLRGAASGTVRAQLTRIYAKAGVSGRAQFAAFFVEDLLSAALVPPPFGAPRPAVPTA